MNSSLSHAELVGDWVGLRPARTCGIRLSREDVVLHSGRKLRVVHNYGHGGSGLTLFRGCALDVLHLVAQCLGEVGSVKAKL